MTNEIRINWRAPGAVTQAFVADATPIAAIMGPVGSGKTTSCLVKSVRAAQAAKPGPDGVRRWKHLIIRDTFMNLQRTILPSWFQMFPKEAGEWVGGPPAVHRLAFDDGHGRVELQVDFMGVGDDTVENLLRGYEMNSFHANEADLLSYAAIDFLYSRTGRYRLAVDGPQPWRGGWMDFNAPEQDHWLHELLVEGRIPESDPPRAAEGFSFHRQPGGLTAQAENRRNLPPNYYERMLATMPDWRARRMIHNEWGYSRDGKPVYGEFRDSVHVAPRPLDPAEGVAVGIGMDAGGIPAAVFGQFLPGGRLHLLDELVTGPGTGPRRFSEGLLEIIARRYRDYELFVWTDPSAAYGGDRQGGDPSWLEAVQNHTKLKLRPAPTNSPAMRQEALRAPLGAMVEGRPAFQMSPTLRVLRKAMNSGYRLRRVRAPGAARYDDRPEKNMFSHVAEAAEYLALGGTGAMAAALGRRQPARLPRFAAADYDPFARPA